MPLGGIHIIKNSWEKEPLEIFYQPDHQRNQPASYLADVIKN
jgi:hypothetical protein